MTSGYSLSEHVTSVAQCVELFRNCGILQLQTLLGSPSKSPFLRKKHSSSQTDLEKKRHKRTGGLCIKLIQEDTIVPQGLHVGRDHIRVLPGNIVEP